MRLTLSRSNRTLPDHLVTRPTAGGVVVDARVGAVSGRRRRRPRRRPRARPDRHQPTLRRQRAPAYRVRGGATCAMSPWVPFRYRESDTDTEANPRGVARQRGGAPRRPSGMATGPLRNRLETGRFRRSRHDEGREAVTDGHGDDGVHRHRGVDGAAVATRTRLHRSPRCDAGDASLGLVGARGSSRWAPRATASSSSFSPRPQRSPRSSGHSAISARWTGPTART